MQSAADLIDIQRHPIADLGGTAGPGMLDGLRRGLAETGVALLPGFLTPAATAAMAAEARQAAPLAYFCDGTHNAYLEADDTALPPDDPRRRRERTWVGSVAFDLLPGDALLRRLYGWDALVALVAAVVGRPALYRLADPLGALSINVFEPGGRHGWHFDEAEFTTTLMLQEAESGGDFEYVPNLRRDDGAERDAVGRILDGDRALVRRLPFTPGTLSIFAGRVSLHRVTEVRGRRQRLVAVLCFADAPGVTNSDEVRMLFWGRTR